MANSTPSTCKLILNEKIYGSVIYDGIEKKDRKLEYIVKTHSVGESDASIDVIKKSDGVVIGEDNIVYTSGIVKTFDSLFSIRYNSSSGLWRWELLFLQDIFPYSQGEQINWGYGTYKEISLTKMQSTESDFIISEMYNSNYYDQQDVNYDISIDKNIYSFIAKPGTGNSGWGVYTKGTISLFAKYSASDTEHQLTEGVDYSIIWDESQGLGKVNFLLDWKPNKYVYSIRLNFNSCYRVSVTTVSTYKNAPRFYHNATVPTHEEQITDISNFTKLYSTTIRFGNNGSKVSENLDLTDESTINTRMQSGWSSSYSSCYDSEDQIGAYGGYDFGESIFISKCKFWIGKYSAQNTKLLATVEYLDENGDWNELSDLEITTSLPYPVNVFEVNIGEYIYGIRWIHKKEPYKSIGNNIVFFGMTVYESSGDTIDVYIPEHTGINLPPAGFDGFDRIYIGG